MNQRVQVDAVGFGRRDTADHLATVDGEDGLEDGIGAQQQREDRRDGRVAMNQQDAELSQQEAQQVGATVSQEDQAGGRVPHSPARHPP